VHGFAPLMFVIGVARILFRGVHFFFAKKVDDLFLVLALKDRLNIPSKSNLPSKNCPKNWLLLWLGVHFVSWGGAFTHFPCKLRLKKIFFTALGGAGAPTAPPGSPMMFVEFPAQLLLLYAKWRYNWLCGVNNRRWVCVHALRWYWTLPRSAEFTSCRPVGSLAFIAVMRSIDSRHALYYVDRTNVQSVKQSGDWQNSCPLVIALISLMEQMTNANVIVQ